MQAGEVLGRFQLLQPVADGVWLAHRQEVAQSAVAVFAEREATFSAELLNERRQRLAQLAVPELPRFLDAAVDAEGRECNLYAWLPGISLLEAAKAGNWSLNKRVCAALPLLRALAACHAALLAHGEINAESFRVTDQGELRLMPPATLPPGAEAVHADRAAAAEWLARLLAIEESFAKERTLSAILATQYDSLHALAEDLQAWQEHRPTSARDMSQLERALLFVRRNAWQSALACVLTMILMSAVVYSAIVERQARQERDRARERLLELERLTERLDGDLYPAVSRLPNSAAARSLLIAWTRDSLTSLEKEARQDSSLRPQVAKGYRRLAKLLQENQQAAQAAEAVAHAAALENNR